jgi:hypothetical protein
MGSTSNVTFLYLRVFFAFLFITFLCIEIATSIYTRSLFIITVCAVRFIVSDGSVGLHLLAPQHGYLTFVTSVLILVNTRTSDTV